VPSLHPGLAHFRDGLRALRGAARVAGPAEPEQGLGLVGGGADGLCAGEHLSNADHAAIRL
jgi:hypothetical protein